MTQKGVEKAGIIAGCILFGSILIALVVFVVLAIVQTISSPTNDNVSLLVGLFCCIAVPCAYVFIANKLENWFNKLPKE